MFQQASRLTTSFDPPQPRFVLEEKRFDLDNWSPEPGTSSPTLTYPGLELIHPKPDIFVVHDFLTPHECESIVVKARGSLERSASCDGHEVEDRTSEVVAVSQRELPTPTNKILRLFSSFCEDARQLEALQVIRYSEGQRFDPHLDALDGPFTSSGFVASARLATLFVYLADTPRGGETTFPLLGLRIRPTRGMAVVHFPTRIGVDGSYVADQRCLHEGSPAVDEKWLLATWIWATAVEPEWGDSSIPELCPVVV
jgi:prolyl 4-hydroxylase